MKTLFAAIVIAGSFAATIGSADAGTAPMQGPVTAASPYGTAQEAREMLDRAVVELKANEAAALAKFNRDDGGFREADLYVACFDAASGKITAHPDPARMGGNIRDMKQADGKAFGQEIFTSAKEGAVATVTYMYPRPGMTKPVAKESYVTRVGGQGCIVGYYK